MSRARLEGKLEGFQGPFFPENIDELNDAFHALGEETNGLLLNRLAKGITGYMKIWRPTTIARNNSGTFAYEWFWGLSFASGESVIAVLFPWSDDSDEFGGLRLDRSCAVYTEGNADPEEIKKVLESVRTCLSG